MNSFYRIFHKATAGLNDFIPFKINWMDIPRSTDNETFKRNQVNTIGELKFRQEYECVAGDTMVTIKNEETGEVASMPIEEVEKMLMELSNMKEE